MLSAESFRAPGPWSCGRQLGLTQRLDASSRRLLPAGEVGMGTLRPAGRSGRTVSIGAGNEQIQVQKLSTETTRTPCHLASAPMNSEPTAGVLKKRGSWKGAFLEAALGTSSLSPSVSKSSGGKKSKEMAQLP